MLEACEDRTTPTPVITIASLGDVTEGAGINTAYARLTRTDTSGTLIVNYTLGGTATGGGTDYYSMSTSVTFMDGNATADASFMLNNDSTSEPTETIVVTLASGSGYTIGSPDSATVNILDNDAQVIWVGVEYAGEDDDEGRVVFNRLGDLSGGLTVNYTVTGTATSGTDYTAIGTTAVFGAGASTVTKTITALPDNLVEGNETVIATVIATVTSGSGYSIGSPGAGTVTISDAPVVVAVEASDTFEGAATGGFSVTRVGGDLSAELTVTYTITGTATSGTDYTALTGTVTFEEDQDRVELWVEAFGDNTVDDAETVIATLTGAGTTYELDSSDYIATVTIADQPQSVSVVALNDGTEGGTNPKFQFSRAGDLSEELTVYYTVSGTATSGTDFTALSGSVTFAEDEDEVDVTVYLSGDSTGEHTETVTVTLDEAEEFLFGNDSDTVFIFDNDTRQLVWTGLGSDGDWTNSDNWYIAGTTTNATPTQYDDTFFTTSGTGNVTNVGDGLSTLYGLHITGTYNGTLTLANGLSVGTFEQTIGTMQMLDDTHDLTVTHALLWSGGTLGATDDGADVVIDDASARIDPPDTGNISTSSTLRFIGTTVATFLPGTLNLATSGGLYIAANAKMRYDNNTDTEITKDVGNNKLIDIAAEGKLTLLTLDATKTGKATFLVPLQNSGVFNIQTGIHLFVEGRIGATGPSVSQTGGATLWASGSNITAPFGMSITGGDVQIWTIAVNADVIFVGNFVFNSPSGRLGFITLSAPNIYGKIRVEGNVTFTNGLYDPRVDWNQNLRNDNWTATGEFTIAATASFTTATTPPNPDNIPQGRRWDVVLANGGFQGPFPALPAELANYQWVELPGAVKGATGNIRRK